MNRADLRTRIRQRADMVNSTFVSDDEINGLIDTSTEGLYDFLVSTYGDEKFAKSEWLNMKPDWTQVDPAVDPNVAWPATKQGFSQVASTYGASYLIEQLTPDNGVPDGFTLPSDFLRMVRVHFTPGYVEQILVTISPEGPEPVNTISPHYRLHSTEKLFYPMHQIELFGQVIDTKRREWRQTRVCYRLVHGPHRMPFGEPADATVEWRNEVMIQFLPPPKSRYAVQFLYVPKPRLLTNDTTQFAYDYTDWIIFDCAAECLEKQDMDSTKLRALLERVKDRIANNARTIDAGQVPQVVDVYGSNRQMSPDWTETYLW